MFFLVLLLRHMQLLLCSIHYLRAIFMSLLSTHSLSLQSFFHHQWIYLSLQLCFVSMLSKTFLLDSLDLLNSLHAVCYRELLFMMLLFVMLMLSYLDVLVYEQLDIFVSRQAHRHLINCISRSTLNGVFNIALFETIAPALLRGRWTLALPGYMEELVASNLSVKNQNEHENLLATYLCDWSRRLDNLDREVGRLTAKTTQGIVYGSGKLTVY